LPAREIPPKKRSNTHKKVCALHHSATYLKSTTAEIQLCIINYGLASSIDVIIIIIIFKFIRSYDKVKQNLTWDGSLFTSCPLPAYA